MERLHENRGRITAVHINNIASIPAFAEALSTHTGELNDESICKVVCDTALGLSLYDPLYRKAFKEARHVYSDVYGALPIQLYPKASVPGGYEDQAYLIEVLDPLCYHSKRVLLSHTGFLEAARNRGTIKDIQTAYLVFELVFFDMIKRRFRKSKHEDKRNQYTVFRNIADEFCTIIFEDPTVWRERLAAKLS